MVHFIIKVIEGQKNKYKTIYFFYLFYMLKRQGKVLKYQHSNWEINPTLAFLSPPLMNNRVNVFICNYVEPGAMILRAFGI